MRCDTMEDDMQLTDQHRTEFERQGFTLIDDVFSDAEMDAAAVAIDRMYDGRGEKTDGIISNIEEPGLFFLFQHPRLERIAQHILQAEHVVHASNASLFKRPDHGATQWHPGGEHVDIMHSLEEMDATPKRMMCMIMVFIGDLPHGRANTVVRPGSHRTIAQYLAEHGLEPMKAHPTPLADLPKLAWPDAVPVVAKRGQALAFNTCIIHGGSNNITDEPRRLLFINFCARGMMKHCTGNNDRRAKRKLYRQMLHEAFEPDRKYLMLDSED